MWERRDFCREAFNGWLRCFDSVARKRGSDGSYQITVICPRLSGSTDLSRKEETYQRNSKPVSKNVQNPKLKWKLARHSHQPRRRPRIVWHRNTILEQSAEDEAPARRDRIYQQSLISRVNTLPSSPTPTPRHVECRCC